MNLNIFSPTTTTKIFSSLFKIIINFLQSQVSNLFSLNLYFTVYFIRFDLTPINSFWSRMIRLDSLVECFRLLFFNKKKSPRSTSTGNWLRALEHSIRIVTYVSQFKLINVALGVLVLILVVMIGKNLKNIVFRAGRSVLTRKNLQNEKNLRIEIPDTNRGQDEDASANMASEEERFLRNIPRLYYGFYRLIKCIIHPGLLEYIAATYFKKELRSSSKSHSEKRSSKKDKTKKHRSNNAAQDEQFDDRLIAEKNEKLTKFWDSQTNWDQKLPSSTRRHRHETKRRDLDSDNENDNINLNTRRCPFAGDNKNNEGSFLTKSNVQKFNAYGHYGTSRLIDDNELTTAEAFLVHKSNVNNNNEKTIYEIDFENKFENENKSPPPLPTTTKTTNTNPKYQAIRSPANSEDMISTPCFTSSPNDDENDDDHNAEVLNRRFMF